MRTIEAGDFARGLAFSPDESRLYVTEYYTGAVLAIDLASGKIVDQWPGISNDNLARQIAIHPSRAKAYLPHIRSRVTAVHGEGSIFPYVSVIDTAPSEGTRRRRVPMDAFLGNLVTSNPWETAISPDGRQFYVVFAGTDDIFACDVIDDDYREIAYRKLVKLGRNPAGCPRRARRTNSVCLQRPGLCGHGVRREVALGDGDDCRHREPAGRRNAPRQSPVLFGPAADGRPPLDYLRELPSRRRPGRPDLAQPRGAAQYAVARSAWRGRIRFTGRPTATKCRTSSTRFAVRSCRAAA